MSSNLAIYYHPDGFDTSVQKLMGRQAAGEGFLRGWVKYSNVDCFYCQTRTQDMAQHFTQTVGTFGGTKPIKWLPSAVPQSLQQPGALFIPGPSLRDDAWLRRASGPQHAYSIVGVTHTTASKGAMDELSGLLTAPVQPWDAVICTSHAVRAMVRDLLDSSADYLRSRFGLGGDVPVAEPQLPVIPLGVECDLFAQDTAARARLRNSLGAGHADIIVLFVGRLSFHAKAHPMVMYRALQRVVRDLPIGARLHLVEAGWFANDSIAAAYRQQAALLAPDVIHHVLDGRLPDIRQGIWQAADIFCSLADNIQETYGLTPVEAMAAGLPSVVTDWDGYKDTVRDGIDGYRVPTWMPPSPLGEDIAFAHAADEINYDLYCGLSSQFVVVDEDATAQAISRLATDADLRQRMGAAARERARTVFDWRVVIHQYQQLLTELAAIRIDSAGRGVELASPAAGQPRWPQRTDPFRSFGGYPSYRMGGDMLVERLPAVMPGVVQTLLNNPMIAFASRALPPVEGLETLLDRLPPVGQRVPAVEVLNSLPPSSQAIGLRTLAWFAKHGLVRLTAPRGSI